MYERLETPTLVVDLDILQANIRRMADLARLGGAKLRPHIKTHKSPWIAHMQLQHGATGITVAKLGEAEVMAAEGIDDILVAYPVVGEAKLARLERLLAEARVVVALDSVEAAQGVAEVGLRCGRPVPLYIDVDTGQGRLGQPPGLPTVELVQKIAALSGVEVIGLTTHAGHLYGARDGETLARGVRDECAALVDTAAALQQAGHPVMELSPGTTPGAQLEAQHAGITEIRPGTYVFNDVKCIAVGAAREADCAATILATVVSCPEPGRAVVDAGSKTIPPEAAGRSDVQGFGRVKGHPAAFVERLSEEHGILSLEGSDLQVRVGDRVEIIPNHICPAVNLSDVMVGVRVGVVEREIPVAARGRRT